MVETGMYEIQKATDWWLEPLLFRFWSWSIGRMQKNEVGGVLVFTQLIFEWPLYARHRGNSSEQNTQESCPQLHPSGDTKQEHYTVPEKLGLGESALGKGMGAPGTVLLNRVVRERITEKVLFGQRLEGEKERAMWLCVCVGGALFQAEGPTGWRSWGWSVPGVCKEQQGGQS